MDSFVSICLACLLVGKLFCVVGVLHLIVMYRKAFIVYWLVHIFLPLPDRPSPSSWQGGSGRRAEGLLAFWDGCLMVHSLKALSGSHYVCGLCRACRSH